MRTIYLSLFILYFLGACKTPAVNNISKIPAATSYNNFLVLYVDNNFETFRFDKDAYNLFVKDALVDPEHQRERAAMENFLYKEMTPYAHCIKSIDVLHATNNSYESFRHLTDSLKVDAILLVTLSKKSVDRYQYPGSSAARGTGDYNGPHEYNALNATFDTYLLAADNKQPMWIARTDMKNKSEYRGKTGLKRKFAGVITKALQKEGYLLEIK